MVYGSELSKVVLRTATKSLREKLARIPLREKMKIVNPYYFVSIGQKGFEALRDVYNIGHPFCYRKTKISE